MNKQTELDKAIEAMQDELQKHIAQNGRKAERIYKKLSGELSQVIASHANKEGRIDRRRLNTLIKEFDNALKNARTDLFNEITEIIKDTAGYSLTESDRLFLREVGQNLIASELHNKVIDAVVKAQIEEEADDRLLLSDRVWILTNDVHAELTKTVTASVLKNESISAMIAAVAAVHANEEWKIRRMVITEANTAHRTATGLAAKNSKVVDAIKLNDSHRPHKNHASHRCYELARADDYGLGQGVYPKDKYGLIAMPHPQCSAYISYVLNDKYL